MTASFFPSSLRRVATLTRRAFGLIASLAVVLAALAQTAVTGLISGRVFNPTTGEYVRNAEVRIEGTQQIAITEEGGYYRLPNAPLGAVTLRATYTGHESATTRVVVSAENPATHDFELASSSARSAPGEAVRLGAFVVSSEREGQAKAVTEQRNAMNVKTVVAADNFGDIAEGNIGEFLKFMPGVTLDYVETDTRAARMGGLEARYGYVTLDGGTMANVNTGTFGGDTRQFEFEAVSINNIESIEVNKTLSADMPADAPAGTVNLRSRSALDRRGRRFNFSLGFVGNQYEHSFRATPRHDDQQHPKSRPTGSLDYSDSFFGNKLGVAVNGAFSNVFKEQFRHSQTYDYTSAQAIAAGRPLITALNFKDGPKEGEKSSGGLKLDYQPFGALRLTFASSYTMFSDVIANRNLNFRVSAADIDPSSTLTKIIARPTANANTRLEQSGSHGNKKNDTTNLALGFTYKAGRLSADGQGSYSRARGQNGSLHMAAVDNANVQLTRIGWTAERASVDSPSWYFTQTPGTVGGSWYDLNSWGRSDTQTGNITNSRSTGKTEQFVGKVNLKYVLNWKLPTTVQAGLYEQVSTRSRRQIFANTLTYVGPTGSQLTSPLPASIASFLIATPWGGNLQPLPVPDKEALFVLQRESPQSFISTLANQVANLETVLSSPQNNQEQIGAAYLQQNTRVGRWQLQGGWRFEHTRVLTAVPSIVGVKNNPFAIVTTNATTGVKTYAAATTLPYVNYKYSGGLTKNYGKYTDAALPSASAKYQVSQNFNLKFGYNKAIKRPPLSNIAGGWSINAADTIITVPNAELKPEHSETFSALAEYYFEPAGTVSLHVFERVLNGAIDTTDPLSAADFGYENDPVYGTYEFVTFEQIPGVRRVKGLELNYAQQLTFLPARFRGFGVFATYSRFNSHLRPLNFVPQNASGGVSYRAGRFSGSLAATWTDRVQVANALTSALNRGDVQFLQSRLITDINLGFRLTRHTDLYLSGRNAFNEGKNWSFASDGRMQMKERYGGQWNAGLKGRY